MLADGVPARHLESPEHERRRAVERVPARAEDAVDQTLWRERRVTDEQRGHLLRHRPDDVGIRSHADVDLPDASDAHIGVELDETDGVRRAPPPDPALGPHQRQVQEGQVDVLDSHARTSRTSTGTSGFPTVWPPSGGGIARQFE